MLILINKCLLNVPQHDKSIERFQNLNIGEDSE